MAIVSWGSAKPGCALSTAVPLQRRAECRQICVAAADPQGLQSKVFSAESCRNADAASQLSRQSTRTAALGLLRSQSTSAVNSHDRYDGKGVMQKWSNIIELQAAVKVANGAVMLLAVGACVAPETLHLEAVRSAYATAMSYSPLTLMGCISGLVYGLGDITAQAFDSRISFSDLDWHRTMRSAAIGLLAHGPLAYYFFSSDNSLIDQAANISSMEEWQQIGMKVILDQTAGSVVWNTLYFALLGLLRRDALGAVAQDLRDHGLDLLKAGWRLWPMVHLFTYSLVSAQDRLLFVDMVELAWITVLLIWTQQTAAKDEDDELPTPAASSELAGTSTYGEMRAHLIEKDGVDNGLDAEQFVKSDT